MEGDEGKEYSALRKAGTAAVKLFQRAVNSGVKKWLEGSGGK